MATAVWVRSFRRRSLSVALFFRCDRKPLLGISKLKARKRRRTERCAPRIDNNNRLTQKKNRQALDDVVVAPVSSERRTTTPRRNADSYRRPKVERYPKKPRNIIRTLNNCNMEQYHRYFFYSRKSWLTMNEPSSMNHFQNQFVKNSVKSFPIGSPQ